MFYYDLMILRSAVEKKDPVPTVLRCSDSDPEIQFRIQPLFFKNSTVKGFFYSIPRSRSFFNMALFSGRTRAKSGSQHCPVQC